MSFRRTVRKILRNAGFDVVRYDHKSHPEARRVRLIAEYGISVILDVGANTGQYAAHLRDLGYAGRIISFEPLQAEYGQLEKHAASDPQWDTEHYALGDTDGDQEINVAENSYSSSILEVLPRHLDSEPAVQTVTTQSIEIHRLDTVYDELCSAGEVPYLKLDCQGYEMRILTNAARSLEKIDTIQLEMSLTPLYAGETLLPDMTRWLYDQGYTLVGLEPGHADSNCGQLMQVDGIFHRFRS